MPLCSNLTTAFVLSCGVWGMTIPALAQSMPYKDVKGWKIHSYTDSESSPTDSCSAVYFRDQNSALRIERFSDGYLFGINGLNRDSQGPQYELSFWFDGDKSGELGGEAAFIKDIAYLNDDWLSFFHPVEERATLIAGIANKSSMSFAYNMPGNRTGNDLVTIDFELKGSAAALLALDECYDIAIAKDISLNAPITSTMEGVSCPNEGPRLPLSGICQGRGVNYLNIVEGDRPELPEGCDWKLNETLIAGDFLLYLAASCGNKTAKLEAAVGARRTVVSLAQSAVYDGAQIEELISIGSAEEGKPHQNVLFYAQDVARDGWDQKCHVRLAGYEGWPADALVVDTLSAKEAMTASSDGPRFPCGPMGLDDENGAFWRVFDGYSWFFNLGQDAFLDIDLRSLTMVSGEDVPNKTR